MSNISASRYDEISRKIEEQKQLAEYEQHHASNTMLGKLGDTALVKQTRAITPWMRQITKAITTTAEANTKTLMEVQKNSVATQGQLTKALSDAHKSNSMVELTKEFAPYLGALSAIGFTGQLKNFNQGAVKSQIANRNLIEGFQTGSNTSGRATTKVTNDFVNTGFKTAGAGAALSTIYDYTLGTGAMSGLSKTLVSLSNPVSALAAPFGGIAGLTGVTGGMAIPLTMAALIGGNMLKTKLTNYIDSKDPFSAKTNNANKLPINVRYRNTGLDPLVQAERQSTLAKIRAMGPEGIGVLTSAESLHAILLSQIVANTANLDTMSDDAYNRKLEKDVGSNKVINRAGQDFGTNDQSGEEFSKVKFDGKFTTYQRMMLGMSSANITMNNLLGSFLNIFNTKSSNTGAWDTRDALLMGGDPKKAEKANAKKFGITLGEQQLLTMNIADTLTNYETYDERILAVLLGSFRLQQLIGKKSTEIAKNYGGESFIGSLENEQRNAQLESQKNYSWLKDGLLRGADDFISKTPILKLLSPILHATAGGTGLLGKTLGAILNPAEITGGIKNLFGEIKDAYVDNRIDPRLKNQEVLAKELKIVALTEQEKAYAYLGGDFIDHMTYIVNHLGGNLQEKIIDPLTGRRVTHEELNNLQDVRYNKLTEMMDYRPEPGGLFGSIYEGTVGRVLNMGADERISERYSHLGEMLNSFSSDGKENNIFNKKEKEQFEEVDAEIIEDEQTHKQKQKSKAKIKSSPISLGQNPMKFLVPTFQKLLGINENTQKTLEESYSLNITKDEYISTTELLTSINEYVKTITETILKQGPQQKLSEEFNTNAMNVTVLKFMRNLNETNRNPLADMPKDNLNDLMNQKELLEREKMVANMNIEHLPYLQKIYEFLTTKKDIQRRIKPDEQREPGGILDNLGELFNFGSFALIGGTILFMMRKKIAALGATFMRTRFGKAIVSPIGKGIMRVINFIKHPAVLLGALAIGAIYLTFQEEIDDAISNIGDWISTTWDGIANWFLDAGTKIKDFFVSGLDSVKDKVQQVLKFFNIDITDMHWLHTTEQRNNFQDLKMSQIDAEFEQLNLEDQVRQEAEKEKQRKIEEMKNSPLMKATNDNSKFLIEAIKQNSSNQEQVKELQEYLNKLSETNTETVGSINNLNHTQMEVNNAILNSVGAIVSNLSEQQKITQAQQYTLDINVAKRLDYLPGGTFNRFAPFSPNILAK